MTTPTFTLLQIFPRLPERLAPLAQLAYNLHWSWDHDTIALFRRMDREVWEEARHNPVLQLGLMRQERLEALAHDDSFLSHMDRCRAGLEAYCNTRGWYQKQYGDIPAGALAYFSMEFGLTECIPIYSGGLGVLAGDHLKSASDLGVPLVGVGLAYQQGYFRQYLNIDGWQQELYPDNDFYNMPMTLERAVDGTPIMITVELPGRALAAQIWRVAIGRTALYLLDANVATNSTDDRAITHQLYGGDVEMRIKQEILLGIGGLRALAAVGITPTVCHMNEGHSAFLALERIRGTMQAAGCTFAEALATTRAGNIFTTHTPVPAGIDLFDAQLMERYFGEYVKSLGISMDELMRLGRAEGQTEQDPFNMALFAIHASNACNGVSALHGHVARKMWMYDWPGVPQDEVPIGHVTNGVHLPSFLSREMADLLERYLGSDWHADVARPDLWQHLEEVPDDELWITHERRRERLVAFARARLVAQYQRRGMPDSAIKLARESLLPDALTIGFARRFATYKRATLLMRDKERLYKLLTNPERPVQILFAGKAHPHDMGGKQLIRDIVHFAREANLTHRLLFIEDYDLTVSRAMVQGVDVWVNTPRRPLEASGTSGMKVAANGGLNLSILDGWWDEGYQRGVGWAIGRGEEYTDMELQDRIESEELFNILEREIVPLFYKCGADGLPREWIAMMKASMMALCPVFNTARMVAEYTHRFYIPAQETYARMAADNVARGRALAAWSERIRAHWQDVRINDVTVQAKEKVYVRQNIPVSAVVQLGSLSDADVAVELYVGRMNPDREVVGGYAVPLSCVKRRKDGNNLYEGTLHCDTSGLHGLAVRVVPKHADLANVFSLKCISWK
jgi:starch phosphorylase